MKKKIILIIIAIFILLISIIFPREKILSYLKKEKEVVEYKNNDFIYVLDYQNNIVGINVLNNIDNEDIITKKWDILTKNNSLIPLNYKSPIYESSRLIDYEIKNNVIVLNITDDFLYSDGRKALECLIYNFCNEDIKEISLSIDGAKLNNFQGINITKLTKEFGVNNTFETTNLIESDYVTIIYNYDDYIKPVTYYYDEDNEKILYTVNKAINMASTSNFTSLMENIKYEIIDDTLMLEVEDVNDLDELVLYTIKVSLNTNFDYKEIYFNGILL